MVIFLLPACNLISPVSAGDFNILPSIVHPPTVPPVNKTAEPVISPLCLTLNLLEDIKTSLSTLDADIAQFEPYDNLVSAIVAPAILPPVNNTVDPVIWPLDFNIKLSLVELICVDANSNPPIVPPSNSTFEPVMSPDAFTLNSEADIKNWSPDADPLIKIVVNYLMYD